MTANENGSLSPRPVALRDQRRDQCGSVAVLRVDQGQHIGRQGDLDAGVFFVALAGADRAAFAVLRHGSVDREFSAELGDVGSAVGVKEFLLAVAVESGVHGFAHFVVHQRNRAVEVHFLIFDHNLSHVSHSVSQRLRAASMTYQYTSIMGGAREISLHIENNFAGGTVQ